VPEGLAPSPRPAVDRGPATRYRPCPQHAAAAERTQLGLLRAALSPRWRGPCPCLPASVGDSRRRRCGQLRGAHWSCPRSEPPAGGGSGAHGGTWGEVSSHRTRSFTAHPREGCRNLRSWADRVLLRAPVLFSVVSWFSFIEL